MHFDQNAFGQRIKALRRKENLTLEQMSSALNISIDHLSRIELGKRGASIDLTLDIADLLNVSVDFLVKGTSRMPPSAQKLIAQIRELLDGFEARLLSSLPDSMARTVARLRRSAAAGSS